MALTSVERKRLADLVGVNEQYLYQCLTGRRDMNPGEARRVESESAGALRRWDLCQKSWTQIWPELMTDPAAPRVLNPPAWTVEGAAASPANPSPPPSTVADAITNERRATALGH